MSLKSILASEGLITAKSKFQSKFDRWMGQEFRSIMHNGGAYERVLTQSVQKAFPGAEVLNYRRFQFNQDGIGGDGNMAEIRYKGEVAYVFYSEEFSISDASETPISLRDYT